MSCEGSLENGVTGSANESYSGIRFGLRSIIANLMAHFRASGKVDQNVATEKATICTNLCSEGCKCETTDYENPTAYNNPSVSWTSTATGFLGVSTAGRWTVTYYYIVKAECVDAPAVVEGVAPVTGDTVTGQ